MMRKTREKAAVRPATQGGVTPEELALAGRSRAGRSLVKLTSAGVFTGRELLDAFAAVPERDYGRDRIRAGLFIWRLPCARTRPRSSWTTWFRPSAVARGRSRSPSSSACAPSIAGRS